MTISRRKPLPIHKKKHDAFQHNTASRLKGVVKKLGTHARKKKPKKKQG